MLRIAPLVASLAFVAAATPARAQTLPPQHLCVGQSVPKPPPTEAEKEQADLENWAAQRAEFGFRADIPYIKELVKQGVWEYDVGYIPVTPAENRYLKLRDKLELGPRADRYLRAHRDIDGGLSVEDNWPHEPYLLLHLKRDVAEHLAAIKRLARYPDNLRAERVKYSDRDLSRLSDKLWKDEKALAAAGFHLTGTGHAADGYLHVDLITRRTDFKAYFAKRYGDGLKIEVEATEVYDFECTAAGSYRVAADGMSLDVSYSTGGGNEFARMEVSEFPDRVEVGIVEKVFNGPNTADLRGEVEPAPLTAPLGDRPVVDAYNRQALQQVGARPGQPPCPAAAPEPSQLQDAIAKRSEYGMRADPGYVRARLNGRSLYTVAEARWIARLQRLDDEKFEVRVARLAPKTYAGSMVNAHYPAEPTITYRFKGGARSHLKAIRKLSAHPESVRVADVDFTLGELEQTSRRIAGATEQSRVLDGFYVAGAYRDDKAGVVRVPLVTQRADGDAYFAARFGPHIVTEVVGDRVECYLESRMPHP